MKRGMIPRLSQISPKDPHYTRDAVRALTDLPRYAAASAFSFVFVIACTAGLHELLGLSETLSPAVALVLAFLVNFALLRIWVFPGQSAPVGRQLAETAV